MTKNTTLIFNMFSYLLFELYCMVVIFGCKVEGANLILHVAIEGCFPKLLVSPDGMILYTGVSKLTNPRC